VVVHLHFPMRWRCLPERPQRRQCPATSHPLLVMRIGRHRWFPIIRRVPRDWRRPSVVWQLNAAVCFWPTRTVAAARTSMTLFTTRRNSRKPRGSSDPAKENYAVLDHDAVEELHKRFG
jgi:hypothetical protein